MANPDILELGEDNMVINKKLAEADRVTIVTQGGSGHEPAIEGFVGEGMAVSYTHLDVYKRQVLTRRTAA